MYYRSLEPGKPDQALYQGMSTYSIVGCDPASGETGVGMQSKYLAVGSLVPWARPGIGAAASQAATNSDLRFMALDLLNQGLAPREALQRLLASDPAPRSRQVGLVNRKGLSAAHTGRDCMPYAGHLTGPGFSCQGNCLAGPGVLESMAEAFQKANGDLPQRMLAALNAADKAGGDVRGRQSAALLVASPQKELYANAPALTDLRVDDHPQPIEELDRLLQLHRLYYSANYRQRSFPFGRHLRQACADWLERLGNGTHDAENAAGLKKALALYARHDSGADLEAGEEHQIEGQLIHSLATAYFQFEAGRLRGNPPHQNGRQAARGQSD